MTTVIIDSITSASHLRYGFSSQQRTYDTDAAVPHYVTTHSLRTIWERAIFMIN